MNTDFAVDGEGKSLTRQTFLVGIVAAVADKGEVRTVCQTRELRRGLLCAAAAGGRTTVQGQLELC